MGIARTVTLRLVLQFGEKEQVVLEVFLSFRRSCDRNGILTRLP